MGAIGGDARGHRSRGYWTSSPPAEEGCRFVACLHMRTRVHPVGAPSWFAYGAMHSGGAGLDLELAGAHVHRAFEDSDGGVEPLVAGGRAGQGGAAGEAKWQVGEREAGAR